MSDYESPQLDLIIFHSLILMTCNKTNNVEIIYRNCMVEMRSCVGHHYFIMLSFINLLNLHIINQQCPECELSGQS